MEDNRRAEVAKPKDMQCQECVDKLLEYEEGLLGEPDTSRLKKHLEECSGCRQYRHSLSEVWKNLDKAFPQELEPAADFRTRFWKRVGQESDVGKVISLETELKAKNKHLRYWKAFTAAASLTVVGGVVLWSVFAFTFNGISDRISTNVVASTNSVAGRNFTVQRSSVGSVESSSEFGSDEPYYTDYVLADEFNNNANEDLSDSVIYADYEPDYVMSQELLDMAFDEVVNSAY